MCLGTLCMTVRCNCLLAGWHNAGHCKLAAPMKWSAHTSQLRLLARTQEQYVEMFVPPEYLGKTGADPFKEPWVFGCSKAKGHVNSVWVLYARKIRALQFRYTEEFRDERVLE